MKRSGPVEMEMCIEEAAVSVDFFAYLAKVGGHLSHLSAPSFNYAVSGSMLAEGSCRQADAGRQGMSLAADA